MIVRTPGVVAILVCILLQIPSRAARDYFVSPDGAQKNTGTFESPWDLRTALDGAGGAIKPGDTVYLLTGRYRGHFQPRISGAPGVPIVFKAYSKAAPTLDGNLTTTTASVTKGGPPSRDVTVKLEAVTDIAAGSPIVLAGGSGHDQLLFVASIGGRDVTGTRQCVIDSPCAELPIGSTVWVIRSVLDIPRAVHDLWFQGLEITDSGVDRRTWSSSSDDDFLNKTQRRRDGVFNYGARTKIIDCVIHDVFNGVGAWTPAVDSEYSGVIVFNNGALAPDRGHAHGFYIQNERHGTKTFRQTVSLQNFGLVAQMYTSGSGPPQGNVTFDGTVWVAADPGGAPPVNQPFLLGGGSPLQHVEITNSHFYGRSPQLGYRSPDNDGISFTNNVFRTALTLSLSRNVTVAGNVFAAPRAADAALVSVRLDGTNGVPSDYVFRDNTYYASNTDGPHHQFYVAPTSDSNCGYFWWDRESRGYGYCPTPQSWRETLGYDTAGSTFNLEGPAGTTIAALPNPYNPRRRLIVIYNWDRMSTVALDVSGFLWRRGDRYTLRNVADYYGDVAHGTYDGGGSIAVAMTGRTISIPYGYSSPLAASTFPEFGVFVLDRDDPS